MRTFNSFSPLRRLRLGPKIALQQTRQFHPTKPAPFIGEVLGAASGFVYGVHSLTGLPWVYSLPLTALTVRMLVAMPLQLYIKKIARKERDLAPLIHSWTRHIASNPTLSFDHTRFKGLTSRNAPIVISRMRRELHREWKIPRYYKYASIVQLPIWLAIMESIRGMCGDDRGFLRYIMSLSTFWWPGGAQHALPSAAESSLASEGALWFPDLLAGDPTGALPLMLTASLILNIRTGWKTKSPVEIADLPRFDMVIGLIPAGFKNVLSVLAVYIGYSAWFSMPSALMLYWITSTNVATLQTVLINKYLSSKPALPLHRKVHIAIRKQGKTATKE